MIPIDEYGGTIMQVGPGKKEPVYVRVPLYR